MERLSSTSSGGFITPWHLSMYLHKTCHRYLTNTSFVHHSNSNIHTYIIKMVVSSLEGLSDAQKQELIASLSAIVVGSAGGDVSADSLSAVATASGNDLSAAWASVFASAVSKVC